MWTIEARIYHFTAVTAMTSQQILNYQLFCIQSLYIWQFCFLLYLMKLKLLCYICNITVTIAVAQTIGRPLAAWAILLKQKMGPLLSQRYFTRPELVYHQASHKGLRLKYYRSVQKMALFLRINCYDHNVRASQ